MLHSEEKLTWSGLTVKLRNSTHERGLKSKLEVTNIFLIPKHFWLKVNRRQTVVFLIFIAFVQYVSFIGI